MSDCAALLLAGGASLRMGSPKALLDFEGRPLWRVQLEKLQSLLPSELFISAPRELSLPPTEGKILHDEQPGLGPLAGLWAARQAMSAPWLIVLAIDLPAMTPAYLQTLRDVARSTKLGQVPREEDDYYLGLAAIYPGAWLDHTETYLQSEDRSLQRFVHDGIEAGLLAARSVSQNELPLFLNVNDPADYAEAVVSRSRMATD